MTYIPKTDRKRGIIYGLVRMKAKLYPRFTVDQLTPALTKQQAKSACNGLVKLGELKADMSQFTTVYSRTRKLLKPEFTNRHRKG